MTFGEKLQFLRKQRGLSQEQLAAQLTVSRQAISKWELDSSLPDTENIVQLSAIFNVSTDYLLKNDMEQPDSILTLSQSNNVEKQPKTIRHIGTILILIGGIGIVLYKILSLTIPIKSQEAVRNVSTGEVIYRTIIKYGLSDFLEAYNMKFLFALCCIVFAVGIIILCYRSIKHRAKRTE